MSKAPNKPSIGNPIPAKYKVTVEELDERLSHVERKLNIVPSIPKSFETPSTDTIEYNGYLIRRDLSLGLYSVHDLEGKQVIEGTFNQLIRAQAAIDNRVAAQKFNEQIRDVETRRGV